MHEEPTKPIKLKKSEQSSSLMPIAIFAFSLQLSAVSCSLLLFRVSDDNFFTREDLPR